MKVTSKRDHRYQRLDGVFPTEDNRCQENRKSYNHLSCHRSSSLAAARTNHRTAGLNGTDHNLWYRPHHACRSGAYLAQVCGENLS